MPGRLKRRRAALKCQGARKRRREEWKRCGLQMIRSALGPPDVLHLVVRCLCFDDVVSFHDAFPELADVWENCNSNYARWLVKDLGQLDTSADYKGTVFLDRDDPDYTKPVQFETYLQFVHWHHHSANTTFYPVYKTSANKPATLVPSASHLQIVHCVFLPVASPGIFSSNLVLLGSCGDVLFYKPELTSFRLVAKVRLDVCPQGLLVAPGGQVLLAATSEPYSVLFRLSERNPVAEVTKIRVSCWERHQDIFVDGESFITWGPHTRKVKLVTFGSGGGHKVSKFFDPPSWWIFPGLAPSVYFYIPRRVESDGALVPECLVLGDVNGSGCLTDRLLTCVVDPRGAAPRSYYVKFDDRCTVCAFAGDPDRRFLYIGCLFNSSAETFYSDGSAPRVIRVRRLSPPPPPPNGGEVGPVRGVVGVYRLGLFPGGEIKVRPRFLNPSQGKFQYMYYPNHQYTFKDGKLLKMFCTRTHLSVKLAERELCHNSLIASPTSLPYHERHFRSSAVFAISEDFKYSGHFKTTSFSDVVDGRRECCKYERNCVERSFEPYCSESFALTFRVKYV